MSKHWVDEQFCKGFVAIIKSTTSEKTFTQLLILILIMKIKVNEHLQYCLDGHSCLHLVHTGLNFNEVQNPLRSSSDKFIIHHSNFRGYPRFWVVTMENYLKNCHVGFR